MDLFRGYGDSNLLVPRLLLDICGFPRDRNPIMPGISMYFHALQLGRIPVEWNIRITACNHKWIFASYTPEASSSDKAIPIPVWACGGFSIRLVRFPASNWLRLCCPVLLEMRIFAACDDFCGAGWQPAADWQSASSAQIHVGQAFSLRRIFNPPGPLSVI